MSLLHISILLLMVCAQGSLVLKRPLGDSVHEEVCFYHENWFNDAWPCCYRSDKGMISAFRSCHHRGLHLGTTVYGLSTLYFLAHVVSNRTQGRRLELRRLSIRKGHSGLSLMAINSTLTATVSVVKSLLHGRILQSN